MKKWLFFGLIISSVLSSAKLSAKDLQLINGYIRAMPPGSTTTAIYGKLKNMTNEIVVITDVSFENGMAMFHRTEMDDGIAKMKHLPKITIPPGETVEFAPGDLHIMIMNAKLPALNGWGELTLTSESDQTHTYKLQVQKQP